MKILIKNKNNVIKKLIRKHFFPLKKKKEKRNEISLWIFPEILFISYQTII